MSYIHRVPSQVRVKEKVKKKNVQSENPRVAGVKHVGLITSSAAADCAARSVEVWQRRIVEVQACSESGLVHAAGDSDTLGGGGGGGRRWRVCVRARARVRSKRRGRVWGERAGPLV